MMLHAWRFSFFSATRGSPDPSSTNKTRYNQNGEVVFAVRVPNQAFRDSGPPQPLTPGLLVRRRAPLAEPGNLRRCVGVAYCTDALPAQRRGGPALCFGTAGPARIRS